MGRTTAAALVLALLATPLLAQPPDEPPMPGVRGSSSQPPARPDFLFGQPKGSVGVRGAWVFAGAGSDLYDFVTDQLTIERSDFNAPGIAADFGAVLSPRLEVVAGVDFSRARVASEYRALVDNNELPIEQETQLKTVHLTGGLRLALAPRGREVSRFAWVPRRVVPFVGAGAGAVYYDFQQVGDFVDFVDLSIFPDVFRSRGWAPSAHALAGVDVQLHRALYATVEGRYTKAAATLDRDFIDFDPIDLSGFRLSAGINVFF